uniref:ribosomal protein S14 n=1 Tax=Flexiglena variabilis TaxID=2743688 RepID=UPI0023AA7FE6|nr:ribosomal protein S14 [Flexiglena variabilis]WCH63483.1 ribosomal protein S14 [Flexiglena variabilis]
MSKKSIIQREKKRSYLCKKFSSVRNSLKEKILTSDSFEEKLDLYSKLQKLPRNSSFTRLFNRCFVTGRSRSYYRFFGLSRHVLRDMAHSGVLPGVTKSSW